MSVSNRPNQPICSALVVVGQLLIGNTRPAGTIPRLIKSWNWWNGPVYTAPLLCLVLIGPFEDITLL